MKNRFHSGASFTKALLLLLSLISIAFHLSYAELSQDAIIITLRHQDGIWLDSTMAAEIDSGLDAARSEIDTLQTICARPDYALNDLIVVTDAPWNIAWRQGDLLTGEQYIDSLGVEYDLIKVRYHNWSHDTFILGFLKPLHMWNLSVLYKNHPDVVYGSPNGNLGDGNNIQYFKKNGILHYAFSRGWGDCPAGCIHRYYWYVTVCLSDTGSLVCLEEEKYCDLSVPYIYRWNIPKRYAMTMFESVDSILQTVAHAPDWWVRRHAIEGTWRFFTNSTPWVGEDIGDRWSELQSELQNQVPAIISTLQAAVNDPDPDVSASAQHALTQITPTSVAEESSRLPVFSFYQNYPNPFNSSTTIPYQLDKPSQVRVLLYNILGQRVRELVNEHQDSGYHSLSWDGKDQTGNLVASGIYLCRMKVGSYEKTMRMLLLK